MPTQKVLKYAALQIFTVYPTAEHAAMGMYSFKSFCKLFLVDLAHGIAGHSIHEMQPPGHLIWWQLLGYMLSQCIQRELHTT